MATTPETLQGESELFDHLISTLGLTPIIRGDGTRSTHYEEWFGLKGEAVSLDEVQDAVSAIVTARGYAEMHRSPHNSGNMTFAKPHPNHPDPQARGIVVHVTIAWDLPKEMWVTLYRPQ